MKNISICSAKSFFIIVLIITGLFIPFAPIKANAWNLENFDGGFLSGSVGKISTPDNYDIGGQMYSDSIQTPTTTTTTTSENQLNINDLPLLHSPSASTSTTTTSDETPSKSSDDSNSAPGSYITPYNAIISPSSSSSPSSSPSPSTSSSPSNTPETFDSPQPTTTTSTTPSSQPTDGDKSGLNLPFDTNKISPLLPFNVNKVIDGFSKSNSNSDSETEAGKIIPNQYIVVLDNEDGISPNSIISKLAKEINLGDTKILDVYQYALNGFAMFAPNEQVVKMLEKLPGVDHIEKDVTVQMAAQTLPTGINRIDADLSSTKSGNGAGDVNVDIAIIDTGIDLKHSDLNVYAQKNFVSSGWSWFGTSTSANDDNGHGTHVAGIAAAKDNGIGTVGVAPGARLWAIKVLGSDGSGPLSTIIKGIDYVTQNAKQIEVANMSLGCECTSSAFDTAINNSVKAGVTYVVAAGNANKDAARTQPANNPNVIAVSAIADNDGKCGGLGGSTGYGNDDTLASFSNYGSVVDMAAPGVKILSTYKNNGYATMSGTSMASPHVAGAAALYKSTHPTATPSDVLSALKSAGSTPSTTCDGNGHGYFSGDKDSYREPLLYVKDY